MPGGDRGGGVSKSLPEARACVSARAEAGSGEHGVRVERSDTAVTAVLMTPSPRYAAASYLGFKCFKAFESVSPT